MIIVPFDFETTGTDRDNDRVIEVGASIYSTGHKRYFESVGMLVNPLGVAVTEEITNITGIQQSAVDRYSYNDLDALVTLVEFIDQADAVLGHNVRSFDWPILERWAKRHEVALPNVLIVDTFEDIPGVEPESLITMCAKAGFVYDAHSALADSQASMRLAMYHGIDEIVKRASVPQVAVRSHAPRTTDNAENKKYKFRWNPEHKIWWKSVKETDVQALANKVPFEISVLDKSYLYSLKGA